MGPVYVMLGWASCLGLDAGCGGGGASVDSWGGSVHCAERRTVCVVSPGGSGSTEFMRILQRCNVTTNSASNSDGIKHTPFKSSWTRSALDARMSKAIYVYT